jgi:hypothetical protein
MSGRFATSDVPYMVPELWPYAWPTINRLDDGEDPLSKGGVWDGTGGMQRCV